MKSDKNSGFIKADSFLARFATIINTFIVELSFPWPYCRYKNTVYRANVIISRALHSVGIQFDSSGFQYEF